MISGHWDVELGTGVFPNAAPPGSGPAQQINLAQAQHSWKATDDPEFSGPVRGYAA